MSYHQDGNPTTVPLPFVQQPVGAGDLVARMTRALGMRQCEPCKRRQAWLNQRLRFGGWR
jgi:hypothetical protein